MFLKGSLNHSVEGLAEDGLFGVEWEACVVEVGL